MATADLVEEFKKTLQVDQYSDNPKKAWSRISSWLKVKTKQPIDGDTLISETKVRFVCLSDTHTRIEGREDFHIPQGDVLLHAGDFTNNGRIKEIQEFNKYIGKFPHRHKVVIAGNHDMSLDDAYVVSRRKARSLFEDSRVRNEIEELKQHEDYLMTKYKVKHPKEILSECIYIQDEMIEIAGIKIYGSPWQPCIGFWGFNKERGDALLQKWNMIPDDVDILLTHGPPVGIGDSTKSAHVGCVDLLNTVIQRVRPKFHVFGHIHEGYGMYAAGSTTFINASICNNKYQPKNLPIVFDIDLPPGRTKDDSVLFSI